MTLKTQNIIVMEIVETTTGDYEALYSGSASAATALGQIISVTEVPFVEIGGEELTSEVIRNGFQNHPSEGLTGKTMTFTLACEFTGQGATAGTARVVPFYHDLLIASGLTFTDVTSPVYSPDSDRALQDATLTIGVWIDGRLFEATGCQCDMTITREVGMVDKIVFAVSGVYYAVTDGVEFVAGVTEPTYTPTIARSAGFTFGDMEVSEVCATSWEFTTQTEITQRKCMNEADGIASYDITNRDPQVTASIEAWLISEYDAYADLASGATTTMTMLFSDGAVASPSTAATWSGTTQMTSLPHSEEGGILAHGGMNFRVASLTEDGDFTITINNA